MDAKINTLIQTVRECSPLRGRYAALAALADAAGPLADEVERLTAERAVMLAPAGGVDLAEVLRRAELIGIAVDWDDLSDAQWRAMVEQTTATPALARALMAERAHVRKVEASEKRLMQEAEASRKAGSNLAAENERLEDALRAARNDAEELRLTLAAEQGRAEGAPSEQWNAPFRSRTSWRKEGPGWLIDVLREGDGWSWEYWRLGIAARETVLMGTAPTARAAMLAADSMLEVPHG